MIRSKKLLFLIPTILFSLLLIHPLVHGSQEGVNDLLEASPHNQVLKEGPLVRVKKPVEKTTPPLKKVALTFDDGPDPRYTPLLLAILEQEQVPATFFVVGERVGYYPSVVKSIAQHGHLLANHSFSHVDLENLSNEEIIAQELDPASKAVEKVTGFYPLIMRPPYGALRIDSVDFLREQGWQIVRWSLDTFDWDPKRNKPDQIISRVLDLHHPNAVVLMHCNNSATVKVLPSLIQTFRDLGYQFVTVADL